MFLRFCSLFLVFIMLIAVGGVQEAVAQEEDLEANKAVVQRFFDDLLNPKNLDVLNEIVATAADGHVGHIVGFGEIRGRQEVGNLVTPFIQAFPDIVYTVEDLIAEGDRVVVRWTFRGTHVDTFFGVPGTGRWVEVGGIDINRLAPDRTKIEENWLQFDQLGLFQQLGVVPPLWAGSPPPGPIGPPGPAGFRQVAATPYNELKEISARFIEEGWNQGNMSFIDEYVSADYVHDDTGNPGISGIEALKEMIAVHRNAIPDIHYTIDDIISEGDTADGKVAFRFTIRGNHVNDFKGLPASGGRLGVEGIGIHHIINGQIVKAWRQTDNQGMLQQMGILPSPPPPPPPPPPAIDPKAVVRQLIEEGLNQRNSDTIDQLVARRIHSNPILGTEVRNIEAYKEFFLNTLFSAFPDYKYTIESIISEPSADATVDHNVAVRLILTGTNQGPFSFLPPTGLPIDVRSVSMYRVSPGGRIVRELHHMDNLALLGQLGALGPPAPLPAPFVEESPTLDSPTVPEENKEVIRTVIRDVFNAQNLAAVDDLFTSDFGPSFIGGRQDPVTGNIVDGRENFKTYLQNEIYAQFPDLVLTIEEMIAEGNKVSARYTARATTLNAVSVKAQGMVMYRIADGRNAQDWGSFDFLLLLQQAGWVPELPIGRAVRTLGIKAIARRFYGEVWSHGNLDVLDEMVHPKAVSLNTAQNHTSGATLGAEGLRQFIAGVRASIPDFQITVEDMIADRDRVVTRWTGRGTHQFGDFLGVSPSGQDVTLQAVEILRIQDGQIHNRWININFLGFLIQNGRFPPVFSQPPRFDWGPSGVVPYKSMEDPAVTRQVVRRYFEEGINNADIPTFREILHPNVVLDVANFPMFRGPQQFVGFLLPYASAFPDIQWTIEDFIVEGERAAVRWRTHGTHLGDFLGVPPTGNRVSWEGTGIFRVVDGLLVNDWTIPDSLTLGRQLELVPTPRDWSNAFFTSLAQGLNMISLPLEPSEPHTARSFAEMLSATIVVKLDEGEQQFLGFSVDASGDGFPVEGGKGYIVNTPQGGVVSFVGAAWTNQPPAGGAPPRVSKDSSAWAFLMNVTMPESGYQMHVQNKTTGVELNARFEDDRHSAVWADLTRQPVVYAGDVIEIIVSDGSGIVGKFPYTVTPQDIKQAFVTLPLERDMLHPVTSLLHQNYPNPFNPETWIPYQINASADVAIDIYNSGGQLIRTLSIGYRAPGFYTSRARAAYWDGTNHIGERVSSGVYFYRFQAGDFSGTRKMLILK